MRGTANEWVAALGKKCSASVFCFCMHMYVLETLRLGFRFEMKKSVELSESESGIVRRGNGDENKYILSRLGKLFLCTARCPVFPSRSPASPSTPAARNALSVK